MRARFYNSVIWRFTQEDTYRGDGLNLYAYCGNNPVKYYDPSGYESASKVRQAALPAGKEPLGLPEGKIPLELPAPKNLGEADNIIGRGYNKETFANKPVKTQDAVNNWDKFLGSGEYTNIHPRTGLEDLNRIFSADGKRNIRFGSHEMNSKPTKFHYHEETWTYDPIENLMNVDNKVFRVRDK